MVLLPSCQKVWKKARPGPPEPQECLDYQPSLECRVGELYPDPARPRSRLKLAGRVPGKRPLDNAGFLQGLEPRPGPRSCRRSRSRGRCAVDGLRPQPAVEVGVLSSPEVEQARPGIERRGLSDLCRSATMNREELMHSATAFPLRLRSEVEQVTPLRLHSLHVDPPAIDGGQGQDGRGQK
jgi:hypothetical protein